MSRKVSKNVAKARAAVENRPYALQEAVPLLQKVKFAKFDETVDLTLRVNEGPQFLFGTLNITGLDLNGEAAIKKMWTLKEGKPFNPDYADYFLRRVHDEGVFDNLGETHSEAKINEQAHTIDVTLSFKGGTPANNPKKRREF